MGGHGGLNILPQKKWNVYNYENREKVRRDEEAAAKEEQLKREQSRKRDAEFRLERLRQARGLHHHAPCPHSPNQRSTDSNHINLFEGLEIFPASELKDGAREDGPKRQKREKKDAAAAPKDVLPEDEKYRLGYGVAGKGVKVPWYLSKPSASNTDEDGNVESAATSTGFKQVESSRKPSGKKTLEELRGERMKREKKEKEREQALLFGKNNRDRTSAWRR